MSAMNSGGCTTDEMPNGIGEFGLEATNPIPVNTVQGSILYLGGLRAPDGTRVNNKRIQGKIRFKNKQANGKPAFPSQRPDKTNKNCFFC